MIEWLIVAGIALVCVVLALAALAVWILFPQLLVRPQRIGVINYQPTSELVLSQEECDRAAADVLALRERWRMLKAPFNVKVLYFLGASKYAQSKPNYQKHAQELNDVLKEKFDWLYARIQEYFERKLNRPVKIVDDGGVPGFHIIVPTKVFEYPVASLHYDSEAKPEWNGKRADDVFSFTLPLQLPSAGAGLLLWDEMGYDTLSRWSVAKFILLRGLVSFRPKTRVDYREGWMVCHDGRHYHMMAPSKIQDGEYRMTLQGHGLLIDNEWRLYF